MYEDLIRQKKEHELMDATKHAAISGAGYGGIGGGLLAVLGGEKSLPKVAMKALLAAAPSAALSAGSVYGGTKLMGMPDEDETNAFTSRGALGGGLGGGLSGGVVGALLASGKLRGLAPIAEKAVEKVGIPKGLTDNLLTDYIKKWALKPGASATAKGAALLGGAGAAGGAYWGGGEGMTMDATRGLLDDDEEERL